MGRKLLCWICYIVGFGVLSYGGLYSPLIGYQANNQKDREEVVQWDKEMHRIHTDLDKRKRAWNERRREHYMEHGYDIGPYREPDAREDLGWSGPH